MVIFLPTSLVHAQDPGDEEGEIFWGGEEDDEGEEEEYDEEDEELKPVKGSKTMTGGKVAKVDIKPKIDG